jgi:N-acetyl-anhydromuramyl-L-alanine amidase AmpD
VIDLSGVKTLIKWDKITLHCTDTPNGKTVRVDVLRDKHINERHFTDISYHYIILADGKIASGRPLSTTGAHVKNANTRNIGIAMVGRDKYSLKQFESLKGLCKALCEKFNIGVGEIYCHYEFRSAIEQGKTCPNFKIEDFIMFMCDHMEAMDDYLL